MFNPTLLTYSPIVVVLGVGDGQAGAGDDRHNADHCHTHEEQLKLSKHKIAEGFDTILQYLPTCLEIYQTNFLCQSNCTVIYTIHI